jgi:general L-amino acid transport system ATP-binding protein
VNNQELMIEMSHVDKWFGDFHVLKDINIDVASGERIVICGPSGSGKSTAIRLVNSLEPYDRGNIKVDGIPLDGSGDSVDAIRREVGMVFQHFNLFPHLTVMDNCTLAPIWVRKESAEAAEETAMHFLERVKIPEQARKYPGQLSGGQQQRVAIARSLCMQPKIMLFDEPTSALDPELVGEVLKNIEDLAREGMTMVIVTHEMSFAHRISDRVVFMEDGAMVHTGTPAEIFEHSDEPRVTRFLRDFKLT